MNYLTVEEVAKKLRCSVRSIKQWVRHGDFPPPIRISYTNALYDEKDIVEWVETKKIRENRKENFK